MAKNTSVHIVLSTTMFDSVLDFKKDILPSLPDFPEIQAHHEMLCIKVVKKKGQVKFKLDHLHNSLLAINQENQSLRKELANLKEELKPKQDLSKNSELIDLIGLYRK